MDSQAITGWIDQLADGNEQAADQLWQHISSRVREFARQRLDQNTRRRYDEDDAANSAFHSLCRGLADGRLSVENRDALWGLLAVITSRKISAQQRLLKRQKRGGGDLRGESGFAELGDTGINEIEGNQRTPDVLAEISESCAQLLNALPDEMMKRIVLLKFQGAKNGEVARELNCTRRTVERKLERIRRIWVEAGLHGDAQPDAAESS
ncbi:MAG: ECF-type sigma factor [Gemmataceae bacterium]